MTAFGVCGDANFIYPGARNGQHVGDNATPLRPIMGPICGFRIKQIREGLEDWEYLILCEKLMGRKFTSQIVDRIYRGSHFGYGQQTSEDRRERAWTQNESRLYAAREELARAILSAD
jgi:hypothetical protein